MAPVPRLASGLTQKQTKFVHYRASGMTQADAARAAGYQGTADELSSQGCRLCGLPHIQAAIAREIRTLILTEDFALARHVKRQAMTLEGVPWNVRLQAVKITYDTVKEFLTEAAMGAKEINEMNAEELAEVIRKGSQAMDLAGSKATDVTPGSAQVSAPVEAVPQAEQGEDAT